MDFFRCFGCDLLDIHPTFSTRHQANALTGTIDHHTQIILMLNIYTLFDIQSMHDLPLWASLMSYQWLIEHAFCKLPNFIE